MYMLKYKKNTIKILIALAVIVFIINQISLAQENNINMLVYDEDNYKNDFVPGQVIVAFKDDYEISTNDIDPFSDIGCKFRLSSCHFFIKIPV